MDGGFVNLGAALTLTGVKIAQTANLLNVGGITPMPMKISCSRDLEIALY